MNPEQDPKLEASVEELWAAWLSSVRESMRRAFRVRPEYVQPSSEYQHTHTKGLVRILLRAPQGKGDD